MGAFKRDASGQGWRVGGNGDPGRGLLLRPDISLGHVLTLVSVVVAGILYVTDIKADAAAERSAIVLSLSQADAALSERMVRDAAEVDALNAQIAAIEQWRSDFEITRFRRADGAALERIYGQQITQLRRRVEILEQRSRGPP